MENEWNILKNQMHLSGLIGKRIMEHIMDNVWIMMQESGIWDLEAHIWRYVDK